MNYHSTRSGVRTVVSALALLRDEWESSREMHAKRWNHAHAEGYEDHVPRRPVTVRGGTGYTERE